MHLANVLGVEADLEMPLDQLSGPGGGPQLGPPSMGLGPLEHQGLQLLQLPRRQAGLGAGMRLAGQLLGGLPGELDPGVDGGTPVAEEVSDIVGRFALLDEGSRSQGGVAVRQS